ncbi:MAG: type II toxin-antitoxin system HicA family toxin [Nitrospinota bacterium]
MKKRILGKMLSSLSDNNIRFKDLKTLLLDLGFRERIKGDHYIYSKSGVSEIINLQPLPGGKAKAYQIILKYKLHEGK